ncbi:alpha-galactosidase [Clostridium perfringens]|uniref:alpha-galactosidase n=1 Tax=Clostridium perfringens TaxID=1502 RepID=UPI001ABB0E7A|nr:alpha-galactosidase [Clostridium perfringens]ELC8367955.1 alpha-galactosidase [Clostridium perfringens]ELC8419818.1 alpha-galactosidase [Clostridium perfringens]MBO3344820.1 alpha-galactosidase [Clostridium perfringens]MBO3347841.1 alpha-galactosidase [Clostridium perfringens]MBO3350962.1 alpha-galactosidase [Clostridium perfringens]
MRIMSINYNENFKTFHLRTKNTSYVLKVMETGHLSHLYWGRKLKADNLEYFFRRRGFGSFAADTDNISGFQLELIPQECPTFGATDLRSPSLEFQYEDGTSATDLRYKSHRIYEGKQRLSGLPAVYVESEEEATSLEITLVDSLKNLEVILTYNVFENFDAITRSLKIVNNSDEKINIERVLSTNVDFTTDEFDFIQLSGSWGRERHILRNPLRSGSQAIESRRGASSHAQNLFMALCSKDANEEYGDVYGFNLVYSGNFLANVEVDMYRNARAQIGINPFDFKWLLESKEEFQAPEVVLVYSSKGLNGMSQIYHNLYRKRLCRGNYRDKVRPILINNWEATYFDFNEVKIKEIAKEASNLGMELFVLDDGWFGNRNDDKSSLGDWFVNEEKLKGGLSKLAKDINNMGLEFGLWFEPEMISPISKLYEKHPNWCIHIPGRTRSQARSQLILDLSRKEVCDYIIESISKILESSNISYVKWDMNRNMTEVGSLGLTSERQRETAHRYILGLYRVMEEITSRFPNVLFESCSGGGGRFDPGILYYMPQTWTSDDTDAIERLKIQFGTSMVYPPISMGCHVSAVPNHQANRITPLEIRGVSAMAGNFGYELDITKLSEKEKEELKEQINLYKEIRETVQFGTLYRLKSPFNSNEVAWMMISEDKNEVVVSYVRQLALVNESFSNLKLTALDKDSEYEIIGEDIVLSGDELMYIGLNIPELYGDYVSKLWRLKRKTLK